MSQQVYNPYNWKMIVISQVAMLLMATALSFYPEYFIEVYIAYLIIIMGVSTYMAQKSNPLLSQRKYLGEVAKAPVLFEEKNTDEIAAKDEEYQAMMREFASQSMRSLGFYFLYMIALLAVYYLVFSRIVVDYVGVMRFVLYVAYFEALFLFNYFVVRNMVKFRMMEVIAPRSYRLTLKGIFSTDMSGIVLHASQLSEAKVTINPEKSYIEIDSTSAKLPFRVRLYTRDLQRLKVSLERLQRESRA